MNRLKIRQAVDYLYQGGVIAYPTEGVWGIGCDPWNESAVYRVLSIKRRPVIKGLILVAADIAQLGPLVDDLTEEQKALLEQSWPGPNTWLIPDPESLIPTWIRGDHGSVAVRVSAHPLVRALCTEFGGMLVSTSANIAGKPEIRSRLRLQRILGKTIDFITPGSLGGQSGPSSIRDLVTGKTLR